MQITLNIPPAHGAPAAVLVIDTQEKIKAIKTIRSLGGLGLKEAKDALDTFLAFPNPDAEEALVSLICDSRHTNLPQVEVNNIELRGRLTAALDRARAVEANNRLLHGQIAGLREQNEGLILDCQGTERLLDEARQEVRSAQEEAFPVMYHGSLSDVHGVYTAFSNGDGYYRLVHPAPNDSGDHLSSVSRSSFTPLRGCDPAPF